MIRGLELEAKPVSDLDRLADRAGKEAIEVEEQMQDMVPQGREREREGVSFSAGKK